MIRDPFYKLEGKRNIGDGPTDLTDLVDTAYSDFKSGVIYSAGVFYRQIMGMRFSSEIDTLPLSQEDVEKLNEIREGLSKTKDFKHQ